MSTAIHEDGDLKEQRSVERERFVVLLHMYNFREPPPAPVWSAGRLTRELGFSRGRADLVIESLVGVGFIARVGSGAGLEITPLGTEYIERGAGRRRSIRLPM